MASKTQAKANRSRRRKSSRKSGGTDWSKLRRMSAASVRKGIAADPDAHATDETFWQRAKVLRSGQTFSQRTREEHK